MMTIKKLSPPPQKNFRLLAITKNAFKFLRKKNASPVPHAHFNVIHEGEHYCLRHYGKTPDTFSKSEVPAILLIPPLMLATEVFDMTPEHSTVTQLTAAGLDIWVVDFGVPEVIKGAMERTLADHILAIDDAIDIVREVTGRDIHIGGYSQGGMFAYQVAAYRRSAGLKSVITFGSPVDWYRNLFPLILDKITPRFVKPVASMALKPFQRMGGVPPKLSAHIFKLLSPQREVRHLLKVLRYLHDEDALDTMQRHRRFMDGEGFVAYPAPALADLIDNFVINNRLLFGGLVIAGRLTALSDINLKILSFIGVSDFFAREKGVREIHRAAPYAEIHETYLNCGHLGLVQGTRATNFTWPLVVRWVDWIEGNGPKPDFNPEKLTFDDPSQSTDSFTAKTVRRMSRPADSLWQLMGSLGIDTLEWLDWLQLQVPRQLKAKRNRSHKQLSIAGVLAEQARNTPNRPFLFWDGQAITYDTFDTWVTRYARLFWHLGMRVGDLVGIRVDFDPQFFAIVTALNRINAVSILYPQAIETDTAMLNAIPALPSFLVTETHKLDWAKRSFAGIPILVKEAECQSSNNRVTVLNHLKLASPGKHEKMNQACGQDPALLFINSTNNGHMNSRTISSQDWLSTAESIAGQARIRPSDTIYCTQPFSDPIAFAAAFASALLVGARAALVPEWRPVEFWQDVRRTGGNIVCYSEQFVHELIKMPPAPEDAYNPVQVFMGKGMPAPFAAIIRQRFKVEKIIDFTENRLLVEMDLF